MRVIVDQEQCMASGMCAMALPGIFRQRQEDGISVLLQEAPGDEYLADIRDAVDACPSQAILLAEE